eukprot:Opistho-2@27263
MTLRGSFSSITSNTEHMSLSGTPIALQALINTSMFWRAFTSDDDCSRVGSGVGMRSGRIEATNLSKTTPSLRDSGKSSGPSHSGMGSLRRASIRSFAATRSCISSNIFRWLRAIVKPPLPPAAAPFFIDDTASFFGAAVILAHMVSSAALPESGRAGCSGAPSFPSALGGGASLCLRGDSGATASDVEAGGTATVGATGAVFAAAGAGAVTATAGVDALAEVVVAGEVAVVADLEGEVDLAGDVVVVAILEGEVDVADDCVVVEAAFAGAVVVDVVAVAVTAAAAVAVVAVGAVGAPVDAAVGEGALVVPFDGGLTLASLEERPSFLFFSISVMRASRVALRSR